VKEPLVFLQVGKNEIPVPVVDGYDFPPLSCSVSIVYKDLYKDGSAEARKEVDPG
jgi:hypothetical protein